MRGISVPIYLQFDQPQQASGFGVTTRASSHPFGVANVNNLVARQKYDVVAELVMPRSRKNLNAGNWMMGVELRGPAAAGGVVKSFTGWEEDWDVDDFSHGGEAGKERATPASVGGSRAKAEKPLVLARSRRPAIMTYRSWVTECAYRVLRLPLYVIGWGQESEAVRVTMMENVEFEQGVRNIPSSLRLEVGSSAPLEVYRASVHLEANLEGLRWLMYRHWIISFVVFTGLFWTVEMVVVLVTWATLTMALGDGTQDDARVWRIKEEENGEPALKTEESSTSATPLSDTSRTFPTLPSHQPLHFTRGAARVKDERGSPALEDIPPAARTGAEADDEDEGEDEGEDEDEDADFILEEPVPSSATHVFTDSGIGTSMESSHAREPGLVRRRSGRGKRER